MDPQSQEQPSFGVSQPPVEQSLPVVENVPAGVPSEAQMASSVEKAMSQPAPPPPQDSSAAAPHTPSPADPASPPGSTPVPPGWMPQIADDTDLIEKEWVDKAKEIVAHTSHDPYLQNKEINKVRAEYLKKRYNKEIKPSED